MASFTPRSETEAADLLRACASRGETVEIIGHGSKRGWGRAVVADHLVDMSALSGITLYEPDELVLSARAGTPMAEIERTLAEHDQSLAFEPMDTGPLFGRDPGSGTLGGILLGNVSGPRRIKAGAARDHVLGLKAVTGAGTPFKAGGRVVKNVTGYDLSRGIAGSWGTLALVTDITFKVLPRPQTASTLAVLGLSDAAGVEVLCGAMGSAWEVSGAAHIPAGTSTLLPASFGLSGLSAALLRVEGFGPSVAYRTDKLIEGLGASAGVTIIEEPHSAALWQHLRDALFFADGETPLWRLSLTPSRAAEAVDRIARLANIRYFYDWSGGLVWLEVLDDTADAHAATIRGAVAEAGGHATLVRGAARFADVPAFQPQAPALADLAGRLKHSLDPGGILNPGRMT